MLHRRVAKRKLSALSGCCKPSFLLFTEGQTVALCPCKTVTQLAQVAGGYLKRVDVEVPTCFLEP